MNRYIEMSLYYCLRQPSVGSYAPSTNKRHIIGQPPQVLPVVARIPVYYQLATTEKGGCTSFKRQAVPNSDNAEEVGTSYGRSDPAPYKWSWQEDGEPAAAVDLNVSALAEARTLEELTAVLRAASAAAPPRACVSPTSRVLLDAAAQRALSHVAVATSGATGRPSVTDAAQLLEAYGNLSQGAASGSGSSDITPLATPLVSSVLAYLCSPREDGSTGDSPKRVVDSASAQELAGLLWALSELEGDLPWDQESVPRGSAAAVEPAAEVPGATAATDDAAGTMALLQQAVLSKLRNQDFLASDLCRVVCALGSLAAPPGSPLQSAGNGGGGGRRGFSLDASLVRALNEEVRYQLTEFDADFEAADLGRLISGMAGLRLGSAVAGDEEYRRILMKAVYGKTRSIADKASVDFALSQLLADDPEARSMHYDSRWTHEELRWLPRRERDKRRILKEGWYRTQWGGWSPGGN